jgi:elongation factor Ts
MSHVDKKLIQKLRDITGLGLMDCRKALEEAKGDIEGAVELLRRKGASVAAKRADKETAEGLIVAYIHPGSQIGVLVEINTETDFVARTEDVRQFAHDLCLHITAMKPLYLVPEDVDSAFVDREKTIFKEQIASSGKPEKIVNQIVEGKINKFYDEICLLNQPFIKDDEMTVSDVLNQIIGKTGEKIKIKRFSRFEIGC